MESFCSKLLCKYKKKVAICLLYEKLNVLVVDKSASGIVPVRMKYPCPKLLWMCALAKAVALALALVLALGVALALPRP